MTTEDTDRRRGGRGGADPRAAADRGQRHEGWHAAAGAGGAHFVDRRTVGINLYAPKELIISAWAGTPLPEIEAALTEAGQHLIAEPPDLSDLLGETGKPQTLGGVVATNLSGPRRVAWGAMRDHVMGIRAVTGRAEVIRSGGRVLKNVTGLDLCKLLTGSHGTLGVITEITLKVLPAPEATGTLVLPVWTPPQASRPCPPRSVRRSACRAPRGCRRTLLRGSPAWRGSAGPATLIRIEDFAPSVELPHRPAERPVRDRRRDCARYRCIASRLEGYPRCASPGRGGGRRGLARLGASVGGAVGAAALRPAGVGGYLDWGGGLVWLAGRRGWRHPWGGRGRRQTSRRHLDLAAGAGALRGAVHVVPDEAAALARITRQVKAAMDPAGS